MTKPDWFILTEQWIPQKMGENGVTLPFLIGAIAYKTGQTDTGVEQARKILDDIIKHPVEGYVTEVSWCPTIVAPVLNIKPINSPNRMPSNATIPRPSGKGESLVFSLNLQFRWGLKDSGALLRRLLEDVIEPVRKGNYSRIRKNGTIEFEYGDFLPRELKYIEDTIMHGRKKSLHN